MRKVTIATNGSGNYGQGGYALNIHEFEIVKETEKAFQLERFFDYKGKAYQVWVPKTALKTAKSGEKEYDDATLTMEKWFESKLDSFQSWFFGC